MCHQLSIERENSNELEKMIETMQDRAEKRIKEQTAICVKFCKIHWACLDLSCKAIEVRELTMKLQKVELLANWSTSFLISGMIDVKKMWIALPVISVSTRLKSIAA